MMKSRRARRSKKTWRQLFRGEDGSVTVEFVVWMPLFLVIFAFVVDAGTTYLIQASMWNTAMDCARRMSTGQYKLADTAPNDVTNACVKSELLYAYKPYTVTPTFPNSPSGNGTDDTLEITLPFYEGGVFGVLAVFGGFGGQTNKIDARATMKAET